MYHSTQHCSEWGAITTLASWLLIEALKRDDVSVVGPVVSLTPLWVAFTEPLITDAGWEQDLIFGAVLVVAGVYLVLFEEDLFHPFRRLSDTGVILAILGSFSFAGVAVFQHRLLDQTGNALGISLGTVIASWLFFAVLWLVLRGSPRRALKFHRLILPLAVFRLGTNLSFVQAVQGSDATTVEVIAQLSNLGSVAGGSLFGEEHLLKRGAGAVLILVAVFIVV